MSKGKTPAKGVQEKPDARKSARTPTGSRTLVSPLSPVLSNSAPSSKDSSRVSTPALASTPAPRKKLPKTPRLALAAEIQPDTKIDPAELEKSARGAIGEVPYWCMDYSNDKKDAPYKRYLDGKIKKHGFDQERYKREFDSKIGVIKLEGLSTRTDDEKGEQKLNAAGRVIRAVFYTQRRVNSAVSVFVHESENINKNKEEFENYCVKFIGILEKKINEGEIFSEDIVNEIGLQDGNELHQSIKEFFRDVIQKRVKNDLPFGFYSAWILADLRLAQVEMRNLEKNKKIKENNRINSNVGTNTTELAIQDNLLEKDALRRNLALNEASNELFQNKIKYLTRVHFAQVNAICGGGISIALTKPSTNPIYVDAANASEELSKLSEEVTLSRDQNLAIDSINNALLKKTPRASGQLSFLLDGISGQKKLAPKSDNVLGTGAGKSYLTSIIDRVFKKEKLGAKSVATLESSRDDFAGIAASKDKNIHLDEAYFYPLKEAVRAKLPTTDQSTTDRLGQIKEAYKFRRNLRESDKGNTLITWGASANPYEMKIAYLRNRDKLEDLEDQIKECKQIEDEYNKLEGKFAEVWSMIPSLALPKDYPNLQDAIKLYESKSNKDIVDGFFQERVSGELQLQGQAGTTEQLLGRLKNNDNTAIDFTDNEKYRKLQSSFEDFSKFWKLGRIRLKLMGYYKYKIKVLESRGIEDKKLGQYKAQLEKLSGYKSFDLFTTGNAGHVLASDLQNHSKELLETFKRLKTEPEPEFYKQNSAKLKKLYEDSANRKSFADKKEAAYSDLRTRRDVTPPLMWFRKKIKLVNGEYSVSEADEGEKKRYKSEFTAKTVEAEQRRNLAQIINMPKPLEQGQRMQYMLPQLKTADLFNGENENAVLNDVHKKSGADIIIIPAITEDFKPACRIYNAQDKTFLSKKPISADDLRKQNFQALATKSVLAIFTENSIGGDYGNFSTGITHQTVHLQHLEGITWNEMMQFNRNRDGDPDKIDKVQRSFVIDQDLSKDEVVAQINRATIEIDREYGRAYVETKSEGLGERVKKLNAAAAKKVGITQTARDLFFLNNSDEDHKNYFQARKDLREKKISEADEIEAAIEAELDPEGVKMKEELKMQLKNIILEIENRIASLGSSIALNDSYIEFHQAKLSRQNALITLKIEMAKESIEEKYQKQLNHFYSEFPINSNENIDYEGLKEKVVKKIAEQKELQESINGLLQSNESFEVLSKELIKLRHIVKSNEVNDLSVEVNKFCEQSENRREDELQKANEISSKVDAAINRIKSKILSEWEEKFKRFKKSKEEVEQLKSEEIEKKFREKKDQALAAAQLILQNDILREDPAAMEQIEAEENAIKDIGYEIKLPEVDAKYIKKLQKIESDINTIKSDINTIKSDINNTNFSDINRLKREFDGLEGKSNEYLQNLDSASVEDSENYKVFASKIDHKLEALKKLKNKLLRNVAEKKLAEIEESVAGKKAELEQKKAEFISKQDAYLQEAETIKQELEGKIEELRIGEIVKMELFKTPLPNHYKLKADLLQNFSFLEERNKYFTELQHAIVVAKTMVEKEPLQTEANKILDEARELRANLEKGENIDQAIKLVIDLSNKENEFRIATNNIEVARGIIDKANKGFNSAFAARDDLIDNSIKPKLRQFLKDTLIARTQGLIENLQDKKGVDQARLNGQTRWKKIHDKYNEGFAKLEEALSQEIGGYEDLQGYSAATELLVQLQQLQSVEEFPQYEEMPSKFANAIAAAREILDDLVKGDENQDLFKVNDSLNKFHAKCSEMLTAGTLSKSHKDYFEKACVEEEQYLEKTFAKITNQIAEVVTRLKASRQEAAQAKEEADAKLKEQQQEKAEIIAALQERLDRVQVPDNIAANADLENLDQAQRAAIDAEIAKISEAVNEISEKYKAAKKVLSYIGEKDGEEFSQAQQEFEGLLSEIEKIDITEFREKYDNLVRIFKEDIRRVAIEKSNIEPRVAMTMPAKPMAVGQKERPEIVKATITNANHDDLKRGLMIHLNQFHQGEDQRLRFSRILAPITPEIMTFKKLFDGNILIKIGQISDPAKKPLKADVTKQVKSFDLNAMTFAENENGKIFGDISFKDSKITNCVFINCDLTQVRDIATANFSGCKFQNCKLPKLLEDKMQPSASPASPQSENVAVKYRAARLGGQVSESFIVQ